ncbi:MAG: metallophosphoesterase [Rickettsiales bacterium]
MKIAHITDIHLSKNLCTKSGINSQNKLSHLLQILNNIRPNYIVLTGDLVANGGRDLYLRLYRELRKLKLPIHYCLGNHDNPSFLPKKINCSLLNYRKDIVSDNHCILFVDTVIYGKTYGIIKKAELIRLKNKLIKYSCKKIILAMHHHPIKTGFKEIDKHMLLNSQELIDLIHDHKSVKCVIFGHTHLNMKIRKKGVQFLCGPAMVNNWIVKGSRLEKSSEYSAFRLLELKNRISSRLISI